LAEAGSSAGTNPAIAAYRAYPKDQETAMTIAKILSAGAVALAFISSAALAQQTVTGTITGINRLNGTIAIQRTQSGTVGANTGGATEEFKVQGGLSLEDLHAGDKVSFSSTESGGSRTITKLQKQ
jgi:Cu/Ag efflux protein CusF